MSVYSRSDDWPVPTEEECREAREAYRRREFRPLESRTNTAVREQRKVAEARRLARARARHMEAQ